MNTKHQQQQNSKWIATKFKMDVPSANAEILS